MMHIYIRPKLFKYAFPSNLPVHSYKNADIMILLSRGANWGRITLAPFNLSSSNAYDLNFLLKFTVRDLVLKIDARLIFSTMNVKPKKANN